MPQKRILEMQQSQQLFDEAAETKKLFHESA